MHARRDAYSIRVTTFSIDPIHAVVAELQLVWFNVEERFWIVAWTLNSRACDLEARERQKFYRKENQLHFQMIKESFMHWNA